MTSDLNLLARAITFDFGNDITVEKRIQRDGRELWVVSLRGSVWEPGSGFVYEPRPSSREDDFIEKTRFELDEAVNIAEHLAQLLVPGVLHPWMDYNPDDMYEYIYHEDWFDQFEAWRKGESDEAPRKAVPRFRKRDNGA